MKLRVTFSEAARAEMRDIDAFGTERFGRERSRAYVRGMRESCKLLGDFPRMAPVHPTLRPELRILLHRSHRIFYRVEPDRVLIVRILHHAQATPPSL